MVRLFVDGKSDGGDCENREHRTEISGRLFALVIWVWAVWPGALSRPHDANSPELSVRSSLCFERDQFVDLWSTTVLREFRDVDEDLIAALGWGDEAETPLIVPLSQRAVCSHWKGPVSSLKGVKAIETWAPLPSAHLGIVSVLSLIASVPFAVAA